MSRLINGLLTLCAISSFLGCASTDVEQACRPEIQLGCTMDEFCTIKRDGSSICVPLSVGRLSEGAQCVGFDNLEAAQGRADGICAPGLGCFQDGFYSRCLRFCESSATDTQAACRGTIDAA